MDRFCTRSGRRSRPAIWTVAAVLALCGCGDPPAATPPAATPPARAGLEIRAPRAVLAPGGTGAVYLTIVNPGSDSDRLLAVETAAAAAAEIHETVREGDVMRMVGHPDGLEIPPHGTVELAPGGKHVMLIEPRPGAADTIRLGLRFENAGLLEVDAAVTQAGAPDAGEASGDG
jgi:periplasmic copper chaperone A